MHHLKQPNHFVRYTTLFRTVFSFLPLFFLFFPPNVRPNFNNSSAHVGRVGPSGYFEAEVERERERETGANSAAIEPQFSRSDSCFPCTRDIYSPHRAEVACILCWEGRGRGGGRAVSLRHDTRFDIRSIYLSRTRAHVTEKYIFHPLPVWKQMPRRRRRRERREWRSQLQRDKSSPSQYRK